MPPWVLLHSDGSRMYILAKAAMNRGCVKFEDFRVVFSM